MELIFRPIDDTIREALLMISLYDEQKDFIETIPECLREAEQDHRFCPRAIYDGTILIGFTMYGSFCETPDGERVWMDRLMIDRHFQGKGYGKAVVRTLSRKLFEEYHTDLLYLSVYDDNRAAIHLYEECGFHFTGELDTKGERIMTLRRN